MGMPTIPNQPDRPKRKEVIIDLLESIALEEIALSHILNAEAEKIQAFVGECLDFPSCPTNMEIIKFNKGVLQLLETIVMKEWLLLRKLENVLEFHDQNVFHDQKKHSKCECDSHCSKCHDCHHSKCHCECTHHKKHKHDC